MSEEFEIGQQVAVSNVSIERALEGIKTEATKYYYLFTQADDYIVVKCVKQDSVFASMFEYAAAMPEEPKVTPFTHETFPRGLVYVREKDSPALVVSENLVLGIRQNTIATSSGSPTYAALLDDYELTFEGSPGWLPCGVME